MKLSVIIPAYNEEKIIKNTLDEILAFLKKKKYTWEVLVVDDGSKDDTADLVRVYADKNKGVRLVRLPKNKGKGAALRKGFLSAKGEYTIYSDADLSVPIEFIDNVLEVLEKESGVVIGSRRVSGAKILAHQPWLRENMGRAYTWLTKVYLLMDIADFTCGFKGFRKEAARKIFNNSLVDRWAYDSEILFLAKKYGCKISQVPVEWKNRADSRVVLSGVIFESFKDLVLIRVNDALGKYNIDK